MNQVAIFYLACRGFLTTMLGKGKLLDAVQKARYFDSL